MDSYTVRQVETNNKNYEKRDTDFQECNLKSYRLDD